MLAPAPLCRNKAGQACKGFETTMLPQPAANRRAAEGCDFAAPAASGHIPSLQEHMYAGSNATPSV